MKTNISLLFALSVPLLIGTFGCATVPAAPRTPTAVEVVYGKNLTMYDFDVIADGVIASILDDDEFQKSYGKMAGTHSDGSKPTYVLQAIRNETTDRIQDRLDSLGKDIRIKARKTGKFAVKDDSNTQQIIDRLKFSANGGLESGDLLAAFKNHVSPDYIMTGEIGNYADPGQSIYKLYLRLIDLSGKTGEGGLLVWEDVFIVRKRK